MVELRHSADPVSRYLDDTRAMMLTEKLPPDLRGELVAGCCRSAVRPARGVDTLQRCREGAHHGLSGDLRTVVQEAKQLADWIQR